MVYKGEGRARAQMSVSSPCNLEGGTFDFPQISHRHYCLHLLKMLKCPVLCSLLIILALGSVLVLGIQGTPVMNTLAARSTSLDTTEADTNYLASFPSPPAAREEREASPGPPNLTATSPQQLPFIKNSQCSLHRANGRTRAVLCGLRQLDLPNGASGVKSWNPSLCRPYHCKCSATREVHRAKRTIADNKTTLEYHRYRVFECV